MKYISQKQSRRSAIKTIGLLVGGTFIPFSAWARDENGFPIALPDSPVFFNPGKPITAITLGAGARGNVYGNYAVEFPEQLDIIGVAEPIASRNERYTKKHAIAEENRFKTWEDVFARPKFADAVIITTPDNLHYGPCMAALEKGYDVLLEKPISPSEQECRDILNLTKKTGQIVAVCHVLRYAPYFVKMRDLIHSGAIGEVISVQHMEPIEHIHMSHSYVRGNWHNSKETTPIILAKSCHDLDIIRWMTGKQCRKVQAFGNLKWFRSENAPQGSTPRCTDGCAVEGSCPYSALKIYYRERGWTYVMDLPEDTARQGDVIMNNLKNTNYGRCVYKMDNDQCDHYTANILFEDDITAAFSMEAHTPWGGRRTRVMGSNGFLEGDMDSFTLYNFQTGESKKYEATMLDDQKFRYSGHGGGDWRLVSDWLQAIVKRDPGLLTSSIDQSIESHVMGFAAEKSRMNNTVEEVIM